MDLLTMMVIGVVVCLLLLLVGYWLWNYYDPATIDASEFTERVPFQYKRPVAVDHTHDGGDAGEQKIPREEKFAIIGAGFCGLGVGAAFKRYDIPFEILEADFRVGGNWNHGVYDTVHIISSRRTTEYKDFPMKSNLPDFPSAKQMLDYFEEYTDHWGLRSQIHFGNEVLECKPIDSGNSWQVTVRIVHQSATSMDSSETNKEETRIYKGVVIANGHHWCCRWPSYPGQDEFKGQLLHSKNYKSPDLLRGKQVLVIGGGNSACDIAVEAARFAKQSHCSMRRGYWFLPRTLCGIPLVEIPRPWMPIWFQRLIVRVALFFVCGSYEKYGLQSPDHKIFEHHPTINSELLHHVRLGDIIPHPDIKQFCGGKTVEFVDGSRHDFDLVVCATGFHTVLPMLSTEILAFKDGIPQLLGGFTLPTLRNLWVFGVGQPRYGAGPLITAGADVLARSVVVQQQMRVPLGAVLHKLGVNPPKRNKHSPDIIVDPHQMFNHLMRSRKFIPFMPRIERMLTSIHVL